MTPTLIGRIQTRIALLLVVGGLMTLLVTPALPAQGPLADRYQTTFVVLGAVTVLGIAWELLYHLLMQWRWEKDWPTLFGLLTLLPEGALVWALLLAGVVPLIPGPLTLTAFSIHFAVVWLAVWITANGPLRVLFIRWRFRGGRFV